MHGWPKDGQEMLERRIPGLLFRLTFLRAAHLVVLSGAFEQVLRGWGRRGPVSVLGTAVEEDLLTEPPSRASGEVDPFVVLFLARLDPCKGAVTSVRAVQALARQGYDVRLRIAGDGPVAPELRADPDPRVELLGYVRGPDKLAAYDDADVFLFPTECGEGLPVALLEAMARGLPIVSRRDGAIPDVVVDETMGLLTESVDPEVFAGLLARLIDDAPLRQAMGRTNREVVLSRYSGAASARDLEQIYRSVWPTAAGLHAGSS
jgi:glycosyltransferase involved in cell wall biosynthesis